LFANDGVGIAWSLAKKFDVHYLGLQSYQDERVALNVEGEKRTVTQHANMPRGKDKWDFGTRSLPRWLDQLEPDVLLSINDIQMVQHIPNILCPNSIRLQVMDLPAKKFVSDGALEMQLMGEMQKFREKFPRQTKWIQYAPQDGDPPMGQWNNIYSMSDQVVAMSEYGKWVFKNWFNMDVPRIWHGVDTAVFTNKEKPKQFQDKFVVGNFNRNQPRKQPVRQIIAFAQFAKDKPDVLLHMQMDWNDQFGWPIQYFGGLYGVLNKMIPPQPVGMPREQVANVYNAWDLNVTPTGGEGFGLTHIEGFACGLPSIATDYTTTKELVIDGQPGPRGTAVKCKDLHWQKMDVAAVRRSLIDIDDLTNAFNKYYYARDLMKEHGKNGETWVKKNTTWRIIGDQWIDLVGKVLSGDNA